MEIPLLFCPDAYSSKIERFRVQRSGLKKPDPLLLADYFFLALIVASHPMGEFEYLELWSPRNAGSSGYNLWTLNLERRTD
jgi:hypothetical protein